MSAVKIAQMHHAAGVDENDRTKIMEAYEALNALEIAKCLCAGALDQNDRAEIFKAYKALVRASTDVQSLGRR